MWSLPLLGLLVLSPIMAIAWAVQRRTRNAGVVDVLWCLGLAGLGGFYGLAAEGWAPRRLLVGGLAFTWYVRLGMHLAHRVSSEEEDGRYKGLREELGTRFDTWIFWFFQAQAFLAVLLSLAFLVPAGESPPGWRFVDGLGASIWVVALVGQGISDRQLRIWRTDPANRGRTCRGGLWRYSRHPNYFFEWMQWLVYPVLAIGLEFGWAVWAAPIVMLYLVLRVTGIPPTEEQALKSRGEDYRAYQRTTNAFFPGPPRADVQDPASISS